ncbi:hypothetical protein M413DRAFT_225673 [Hebeloma cylindrosporum]|uniref:Protein kinase domain-containing protein n=1 Tax=Hebeloma cylindrosporum TaxID=76867 RepID=A0A0C3CVR8_HEBCY|nr:hypothetical protein M413DRAFT_225673 [Hebeloma cylindrosporum h7]
MTSSKAVTGSQPHDLKVSTDSYFGDAMYDSPVDSDTSDSDRDYLDEDDGTHTDSTLDDKEGGIQFGHPLERMPRCKSADHGIQFTTNESVDALLSISRQSSRSTSASLTSLSSTMAYDSINYGHLVEAMLCRKPNPFLSRDIRNLVTLIPPKNSMEALPPLMVKCLERSSTELLVLLELNRPELREDPWNPAPHVLEAVERGELVYLCMQPLLEYNQPPLLTVAHYIDFFRQVLEGLVFLHEQRIAGLSCCNTSSFMVDLSSAPQTPVPPGDDHDTSADIAARFDRFSYPVHYYFMNFSQASRVQQEMLLPSSSSATTLGESTKAACPFRRDVQDCGAMFGELLTDVPKIAPKFKSLTNGMCLGGFTADDARRLFEALCRSLDADVFETRSTPQPGKNLPGRSHTFSHPVSKIGQSIGSPKKAPSH